MSRLVLGYHFTCEVDPGPRSRSCIECGGCGGKWMLAHLYNTPQVIGHTLIHRVSQWLEVVALQEGLEGSVKHGWCAEYQEGQGRSWQGQVESWRQKFIVPCHLKQKVQARLAS